MTDDDTKPGDDQTRRVSGFTNMIEVQFERGTRLKVEAGPGGACAFRSQEDAFSVDDLNAFLLEHKCTKAEQPYDESPEYIAETEHLALREGVEAPNLSGLYVLHFPKGSDADKIAKRLRDYPRVKHAAALPLTKFACVRGPQITDPLLFPNRGDHQWYIDHCKINKAWDLGYTGKGVVIADLDTGFQTHHPDLEGRFNLDRAFNTLTCNNNLSVSGRNLRHGTKVAGQVGAAADGNGIVGVAHNAELWPIEVGSRDPMLTVDPREWVKGMRQVIKSMLDDGRRVVILIEGQTQNNGNITQIWMIRNAVLAAIAHGAVVCVAAGNGKRNVSEADCSPEPCHGEIFEPVGIIVGATDIDDLPFEEGTQGTNFGDAVTVSAPGDPRHDLTCDADLTSDFPYTPEFGATSGAAAKVAGAAALMLQANPKLRHVDVEQIFRSTGTPITSLPLGRLLDCKAAVLMAKNFVTEAVEREPVAAD